MSRKVRHDELVKAAKAAIQEVFSDTTVGREQTRESVEELQEEIRSLLDTLR